MYIHQHYLTNNDCYKAGRYIKPEGIMVHSTGADNEYLHRYVDTHDGYTYTNRYGNDWDRPGVGACVHAFIGLNAQEEVGVVQTLPWDMRGWHCGARGNDTHLSFEICEDGLNNRSYFEATRDKAIELCAFLCGLYGFDPLAPGVLVDHAEGYKLGIASGHADVGHWWGKFGYTMDMFRRDVAEAMQPEDEPLTREAVAQMIREAGPRVYGTLEEMPKWARETVEHLTERGWLLGDGRGGLDLSEDMLRVLVVVNRMVEQLRAG